MAIFAYSSILKTEDYWEIGGESQLFGRSVKWPKYHKQPDTYLGHYWYEGQLDNGGIHHNNGVINRMFYLLSDGGIGSNDHGSHYNVTGISIRHAADILYRTVTNYLTSNTNFKDL